MISVTPTKLSDYLTCPLKFKLKHIDRVGCAASSAAFSFGTSMHRALQELHDKQMPAAGMSSSADLLSKFWDKAGYATQEEGRSYFTKGCQALENYYETAREADDETLGTEVYMSFMIEFRGLKIRLGCKADRLALHKNNVLEVVDYKTSQSGKTPTLEFVRADLPTFLYFVLTRISYPQYPNIRFTYLNVMSGAKVTINYERDVVEENKKALWDCLKVIAANNFEPRGSECCSWCDFQDDCPLTNRIVDFGSI
jgi:putative RecB family exonuclease